MIVPVAKVGCYLFGEKSCISSPNGSSYRHVTWIIIRRVGDAEHVLKEKQSRLSLGSAEGGSNLALVQAVLKCKTGVGVESFFSKNVNQKIYTSWNMQQFIDMDSFLR